jgi:hypothetical protein
LEPVGWPIGPSKAWLTIPRYTAALEIGIDQSYLRGDVALQADGTQRVETAEDIVAEVVGAAHGDIGRNCGIRAR